MSAQAPSAVILVRATSFVPNPATAADNAFQSDAPAGQTDFTTSERALAEMDALAAALREAGVRVHVFDDDDHTRPDSVFPNNWISTHAGGTVAVYPMYASNRRHERSSPTRCAGTASRRSRRSRTSRPSSPTPPARPTR